ncbi:hypothetical protein QTP70_021407 [Hemibagrus guttatus]|uniref:ribonuclease H n=1 Tax=Hemibagrus guttatus TaxID=175788 RepID=A0AAE0Q820_9TELE|nr:hypothetical protein QTP70_021407 [Hemibagrus guttatus]
MMMDRNSGSVLEMKRSCLVSKSVKSLLNEFQCVYEEKLRRLECEVKGSQEEILRGAGGNWATVGGRSRGGRRVHRQREKRKGKSVGLRIGTLNVGTMTGKGRELADMMERRKVDILCVQETRWKGSKARSIGAGFKLFYYGVDSKRNGVGVVLKEEFVRNVLEVKRVSYDELYTRLDTREGEKDLYRLARQRDRDGKDVQQVRVIKDRDGRVLTSEESVQRRWKEYFEELMNEENEREKRVEGVNSVEQKVDKIRKDEVRKALKRMKSGKAVGPDDIPVEVWKCLGEAAVEFLIGLFNRVLESERMPEEWRRSVLVPIFKNKGDVQSCSNYRGIKLMSHTVKLWERVVEARLRKVVEICEQQYGFMPRKSTTDAIFALRILMEKYRDGQRELHCVFVDLEKAYDSVPREELWYCMRKSGVAEKYVRVVQDMYERSRTVVRCAVGQTEEFKVEVGLHQGSALSHFLFAIVMDQLSEEVRQESPWTMMFADDIVICSESREQVEENLERWRFALEGRGMKVSRSKTEHMCVNEREGSGTVRLQGEEVKKVQEFKCLGSTVQSNGECGKEMKVRILHSYVNDLSDQNGILVHTVEELEKEANEKVSHLKEKLQASDKDIKDLDHQKRHLEEDNKLLRAEIQKLKAHSRTHTRIIHEARRAHGLDLRIFNSVFTLTGGLWA